MNSRLLGIAWVLVLLALPGCGEQRTPATATSAPTATKAATEKASVADLAAGKAIADRSCKSCHGLDGKGAGPGIPHLAAQRERYLHAAMKEYKEGQRTHAGLRDLVTKMSEADLRNIAAYYAAEPAIPPEQIADVKHSAPYEQGKKLAEGCAKCHGVDGNAVKPGTPSLAGQQPIYLLAAILEYHRGDRGIGKMRSVLSESDRLELEHLALYYATQTPARRPAPKRGDPVAGEALSAMCGGCHGIHGVSRDAHTPSLAGQDFDYLVKATKAYRTARKNWGMQRYVAGLSDKDIDDVIAFYAAQVPGAAEAPQTSTQELTAKCDRCHDDDSNPTMVAPKLKGQDKDYLVMAMRNYRDESKRESSAMHRMSYPYSNAIIESLATWYASQPRK